MGQRGFNRQWARHGGQWTSTAAGAGRGPAGAGRDGGRTARGRRRGWPGLFGLAQGEQQRGPRVRRGDVRAAILDVVRAAPDER